MFDIIKAIIKKIGRPVIRYKQYSSNLKLEKLGSTYGGWIIPTQLLDRESVCYLAGAGEDISFDVELATRFHCRIFIFDPTPRAKKHFDLLVDSAEKETQMFINNNPLHTYKLNREIVRHLKFFEIGVWKKKDILKFFSPIDDAHISHSISNLQDTNIYFEASVESIASIMQANQHSHVDILKLDIEGAEYEVIDSILEENLPISFLCVEFHMLKKGGRKLIQSTVSKLENKNYIVLAREDLDFTFANTKYLNLANNEIKYPTRKLE